MKQTSRIPSACCDVWTAVPYLLHLIEGAAVGWVVCSGETRNCQEAFGLALKMFTSFLTDELCVYVDALKGILSRAS